MATWPKVSGPVLEDVNQNPSVQQLVSEMIAATREYIDEWDAELTALATSAAQGDAVVALIEMATSVQEVAEQLQRFRLEGIELQMTGIAEFLQRSEEAYQDMKQQADDAGEGV